MSEQNIIAFLTSLLEKLQIFALRPTILTQLGAIGLILVGTTLVAGTSSVFLKRLSPTPAADKPKPILHYISMAIRLLMLPILAIIATTVAISILTQQGVRVGLLSLLLNIFWAYLSYRFFLTILYTFFPEKDVYRFHWRLFAPLFGLFTLYQIIGLLVNINEAANVVLANSFGKPLLIGTLFVAIAGLYFWVDIIFGTKDVVFRTVTTYTSVNAGRLEAALTLGSYILLAGGIVSSISYLGVNPTVFAAVSGGLSVGIGFGMQQIFGNFISGIIILFQGLIRPGDIIQVGTSRATITRMGISSTLVRTDDGDEIVIPNQKILTLEVRTFTGSDPMFRYQLLVRASYKSDPVLILKILQNAIATIPIVELTPAPKAILFNLGESALEYRLQIWTNLKKAGTSPAAIVHVVNMAVMKEFTKHGIEVPFPQRDLHLISETSTPEAIATLITEK